MLLKKVTLLPIKLNITAFKFQGIIHTIWSEQKGKPLVFSDELGQGVSWVKKKEKAMQLMRMDSGDLYM